jgi:hypothetical protein
MNSQVQLNLALILFLPWFAILGYVFWRFSPLPRSIARRSLDIASVLMATTLAGIGMQWSFFHADPRYGGMWKQVLATSVAYGLFLLVLTVAVIARGRLFRNTPP